MAASRESAAINGNRVTLQTINNYYFVAEGGADGLLNANRTAISPWKTFTISIAAP